MPDQPGRMLAAATERPSTVNDEAVLRFHGFPGRGKRDCSYRVEVAIHFARNHLVDKRSHVAAIDADHGAPARGGIRHRQRLNHAHLRKKIQLRTAPARSRPPPRGFSDRARVQPRAFESRYHPSQAWMSSVWAETFRQSNQT